MNLFSRSNAHLELTPAERAVLQFLKMLVIAFLLSAAPIVYATLATGDISNTDWGIVLNTAITAGAAAVLRTIWKYGSAVQDVAKGNTVASKNEPPVPTTMYIGDKPPTDAKNGDVWVGEIGSVPPSVAPSLASSLARAQAQALTSSADTSTSDGVGTLSITDFWKTVKGVAQVAAGSPDVPLPGPAPVPSPVQQDITSTNTENVLNQPSPNVPVGVTAGLAGGTVIPVPVSSEAGAPTVISDAPASTPGL